MELSTQQRTIKSRITIEKHKILLFISFLFTGTFTWSKTSDNLSRIDKSNKFCYKLSRDDILQKMLIPEYMQIRNYTKSYFLNIYVVLFYIVSTIKICKILNVSRVTYFLLEKYNWMDFLKLTNLRTFV